MDWNMVWQIALLIIGFVMLIKGADWFVDGAAGIADKLHIPQLIIGLTIVAMGTSAPEAAISISASVQGSADIAVGNILGSNILNILIILGITSVITPLAVQKSTVKYEIPFVIIIDEWDCVIRNSHDQALVHKYLQFLHSLFKSEESKSFLALGYITGILPIKKIKDESALNNFQEYTMLDSYPITEYYGFTEKEVKDLCKDYSMDFETVKAWYNGYLIDGEHMYNPNSVSQALERHKIDSYWRNTSAFDTINTFITMNYAGLKDDVMKMLTGGKVRINTNTFQNDFSIITSKDDALTALIHLGYLGYDADRKKSFIPNYEVATAFELALQTGSWKEIAESISKCDELLDETIDGNAERVAELIELAHETYTSILKYNDENVLSCVLTMAYFTAPAYYNVIREMPSGKGFADFVFLPRANAGNRPAMIIELKYNQSAETALKQIKEKRYQGALSGYQGKILLVGINYDSEKHHTCMIEEL